MRLLTFLLVAGVILSVAKAITPVLILLVVALALWVIVIRPIEVFGVMLLGLLTGALQARPTTTILCISGIASLVALRNSPNRESKAPDKTAADVLNHSVIPRL